MEDGARLEHLEPPLDYSLLSSYRMVTTGQLGASAGDEETGEGFLFSPTLEVFI